MSGWRPGPRTPRRGASAGAASLGEAGVHSSSLPLLAIDPLEETPEQRTLMLDLDRYCAVVVVSKPAARL
ncbi:uroporphyrinogen-III synthase, partial [Pseudomonas aeruginosa]|nr:uroporphyrinogen-III synthase [Pseudomonas aeruginosa]